jgi:hypothetical protein
MASTARLDMGRKPRQHGPGKPPLEGKRLRLADEVGRIQRRAAARDGRIVRIGGLVLFSTETGDAWLLDPADQLAARLARDGDPEPIHVEETDTTFAIGWKGHYRVEGPSFIYADRDTGRVTAILGYPTDKITRVA